MKFFGLLIGIAASWFVVFAIIYFGLLLVAAVEWLIIPIVFTTIGILIAVVLSTGGWG